MKIVFVNAYQEKVYRGAETYVGEISKRLSRSNEVDVLTGDLKPLRRWPILWRFFIDPQGLFIFWFTLRKLSVIWKKKYDIVVPLNGGWQSALVRVITWIYGGKMVISGQSGMGWDDINNLWCFPDVFVALSKSALNWAKKVNPFIAVEYIPNGVDLDLFKPGKEKKQLSLEKPIVLCVAALTSQKRIDLAIKAVSKLSSISLVIVGRGEEEERLNKLGGELLKNRFKIISLPYKEMPDVYRSANLFTLPSQGYQSFEIALVEAMATNMAVVANNDEVRKDIVGDAGILVNPNDISKYSIALKKALNIDWGDKPRNQARKFDWNKISAKYEELFKNI